jgi:hypothetical protein
MENKEQGTFLVTFTTLWGDSREPIGHPMDPHTGNLFYVTHNEAYRLFYPGQMASAGIVQSAAYGEVEILREEAMHYPRAVGQVYVSPVLHAPGRHRVKIETNQDYPFLSFTTMIAPSSNWFTGITYINLFESDGLTIPLAAYDAGSDYGQEFRTEPKHPREIPIPIARIRNGVLFPNHKPRAIAYLTIQRMR